MIVVAFIVWMTVPPLVAVACHWWIGSHALARRRFVIRCSWILAIYYSSIIASYSVAWAMHASTGQEPIWTVIAGLLVANPLVCGLIFIWAYVYKPEAKRDPPLPACPACAYPIGQSPVCTECGAAVTPKVVQG